MKNVYIFLFVSVFLGLGYGCIEDPEMDSRLQNAKAPTVKVPEKDHLSATSLVVKAAVELENGSVVTERGVCWGKEEQTLPGDHIREKRYLKATEGGIGEFTIEITGLEDNTTYYVYTYAVNAVDTAYSAGQPFSTNEGVGSVITLKPDEKNIRATSALLKGVIPASDRGESEITDRGFYLSDKPNPSKSDSVYHAINQTIDPLVDDTFCFHVKNLQPETKYYVLAYAENQFGIYPSKVDSFQTTDGKPRVSAVTRDSIGFTNAFLSAQLISEGDSAITAFGFCWGIMENPTIENDTIVCQEKDGKYSGKLKNLEAHKQYYARAYATNCFGTMYSEESIAITTLSELPAIQTHLIPSDSVRNGIAIVGGELQNMGMSPVTSIGICWSATNTNPVITGDHIIEVPLGSMDENGNFTATIDNVKGGVTYYVRAFAINGSASPGYGNVQSFTAPPVFSLKKVYEGAKRIFSTCFTVNDQAYVVGGDIGNKCTNELFGYNVEKNEWIPLTPFIEAYSGMTACTNGSLAYVMGGTDKLFKVSEDCLTYNPYDNTWSAIQSLEQKAARFDAVSFSYKDSVYLLGGVVNEKGISKEIWRYDITNNDWKMVIDSFPIAQRRGVALVVEDKVYAGLGETLGSTLGKGFWVSTGNLTEWTPAPGTLPSNISTISSGIYYKVEGQWNSFFMIDDNGIIWEYKLTDNSWRQRSAFPYRMKNYHMFILNNQIYILGQDLVDSNKFMMYDPIWDND